MPERQTLERARRDAREGKAPSTQAGEFVREEMEHIREGKHGARSTKQAIAIGLSKAGRAGVKLAAPKGAQVSPRTCTQAKRDLRRGSSAKPSAKRSRATLHALKKEGRSAASHRALATQAKRAARKRSASAKTTVVNPRVTLMTGGNSVFVGDGTALVIHAQADDMKSDPAGNAGDRIACGLIVK